MRQHCRPFGFTLVELIVVVAIVVALLAILMPTMSRAVGMAEVASCASNMRQVGIAGFAYRSDQFMIEPFWRFDNGSADYPHEAWHHYNNNPGNPARALHRRDGVNQGYLPNQYPFFCPSVDRDPEENYNPDTHGDYNKPWGTYTWHYRPVLKANDPMPELNSITHNALRFDNAPMTRNIAMVDTPAGGYGNAGPWKWGPQFEHYNVLFDDGRSEMVSDDAAEFGQFMWGGFGRPG